MFDLPTTLNCYYDVLHGQGSKTEFLFSSLSHGNGEHDQHFNSSQLSWLIDTKQQIIVDQVIKLEELASAWPQLQARVSGVARLATMERKNLSPNSKLSSARVREFYQNEETVRIMLLHIGVDMSTFDYVWPDKLV